MQSSITTITPPRVPLIDPRTGLISREWYRFFLNLFVLTGSGENSASLTDLQVNPENNSIISDLAELHKQINELMIQRLPELGTLSQIQQENVPWLRFNTFLESTSVDNSANGLFYWDKKDNVKTLSFVMDGVNSIKHPIGESEFYRVKASSAILKGQVVMFTGSSGYSGGLTGEPATGLSVNQNSYILGVASQDVGMNEWGYVTSLGVIDGLDTSGGVEAWVDGEVLYYNPGVVGGLTKTIPTAPNVRTVVATVIFADSTNGSLFVRPVFGTTLGVTDSNVEITSLSNGDILQYDSVALTWKNVAASSFSVGTATNIAGGSAGSVPYQTASSTTTFRSIGTSGQIFRVNSGATAPEWVSPASLTKVDDTNVTLTLGGSPTTSLLANTSLTLGWTGQLAISRGGTGLSSLGAGVQTWLSVPSSANLASAITDETGSGSLVFASRPSFNSTIGVGGATASSSGSGISFPSTQSASTDANTLDDYEEGSWTLTVTAGTGSITSYTVQTANYTKIGNLVTINIKFTITNNGTGASYLQINLPFGAADECMGTTRETAVAGLQGNIRTSGSGSTNAFILQYNSNYPASTGAVIVGTMTYNV